MIIACTWMIARYRATIHKYRLDNGYGVEILEPLTRHRITDDDPARQNRVDLEFEGFVPPVMFDDGAHFDQPGRMTGELVLRGERYAIDCLTMRDRSWGKQRPEDMMPLPAVSWMQRVFDEDFSFCATILDHQSGAELIVGTPVTATTYNMWGNVFMWIALMRWDCAGRIAFGDCQDGPWTDHLVALQRSATA